MILKYNYLFHETNMSRNAQKRMNWNEVKICEENSCLRVS